MFGYTETDRARIAELRYCEGIHCQIRGCGFLSHQKQGEVCACFHRWAEIIDESDTPPLHRADDWWPIHWRECKASLCIHRDPDGRSGLLSRSQLWLRLIPSPSVDHPVEGATAHGNGHAKPDEIGTITVHVFLVDNWRKSKSNAAVVTEVLDHQPAVINPNQRTRKAAEHCVS